MTDGDRSPGGRLGTGVGAEVKTTSELLMFNMDDISTEMSSLPRFGLFILVVILTFAVPAAQWFVKSVLTTSSYCGLISSIPIIICVYLWNNKRETSSIMPTSRYWRTLVYLGSVAVFGLLPIVIWHEPVSRITGQSRSMVETIDAIVLVPMAEELIFRGILWSLFEKLSKKGSGVAPAITSLLFGIEHLGYWTQIGWPLPLEALTHAMSMVGAGVCFGALRWKSRSLAVPTIAHMMANALILLIQ